MMFRRTLFAILLILGLELGIVSQAWALEAGEPAPEDVLLIYSDGSGEKVLSQVHILVEILTYQNMKVSYGTASECRNSMKDFSYIICYDLTTYPKDFMETMKQYEAGAAGGTRYQPHVLFVGNLFLKAYFDETERSDEYEVQNFSTGKLSDSFDGLSVKEGLVKEPCYLFLKGAQRQSGSLIVNEREKYVFGELGVIAHIPVTQLSDRLIKAVFMKELAQWKWPYRGNPPIYPQYLLIDRVYPYEDPERLLEVVKIFTRKKIPFAISVMPLYVHGEYPAMTRFCEILRYAQANGGAVIIHVPNNQMSPFDKTLMLQYLSQAMEVYKKQDIYPLALQVPRNWMFNRDAIEVMSHFKTIVTYDGEDSYLEPSEMNTNEVYRDGHQWIGSGAELDDSGVSSTSSYSTAVRINLHSDEKEILKAISASRSSPIPLKSLWDMEHSFWTEKDLMQYDGQSLMLNGKKKDLSYVPSTFPETYDYHRNMLERFSRDLSSQNRTLILLVGITSVLFVIFIALARYRNRKNYFFQNQGEEKP
ncbi:DUF2334 domain-containing protein [Clostridium sp. HBUAS56010]|uniref:DUF2334 domain-containing protein n=1 Tax=Clostridium sp. HBUAS56010 TaxID=2571127 RepID=UPI001177CBF5|nr:DUF2334 domain-containing protein [Clostridium sp. HBUAS56010]